MKEGHFNQAVTRSGTAVAAMTGFRAAKEATTGTEDFRYDVAGASDGATCVGIVIGDAAAGDAVGIAINGRGAVEVDGTTPIAAGDFLKPAATGILVKAVAGDWYIAIAREPATAAGLVIKCDILKGQLNPA